MKLMLNGELKDIACGTVSELLLILDIKKELVVVELNHEIVHCEHFEKTVLKNNDKIEIVTMVGGG